MIVQVTLSLITTSTYPLIISSQLQVNLSYLMIYSSPVDTSEPKSEAALNTSGLSWEGSGGGAAADKAGSADDSDR